MNDTLAATLWTALVLYLLYKTDAVFSYLSAPPLSWLSPVTKVKHYLNFRKTGVEGFSYSDYMSSYHNNLIVKMLSCRYCFGLWLSLGLSWCMSGIETLPIVYLGGQSLCTAFDWVERKLNDE